MPALVTSNFRISNAKQFINSFQPSNWGGFQRTGDVSFIYMFIGKPVKWGETHAGYSDINVPAPDGDVQGNSYEPWRDMIALDRVANTDISHGIKKIEALDQRFDHNLHQAIMEIESEEAEEGLVIQISRVITLQKFIPTCCEIG